MKAGIILCDHTRKKLQPYFGNYHECFTRLLNTVDSRIIVEIFDVTKKQFPTDNDQVDVFFISGSKTSCYENKDWVLKLCEFIRECYRKKTPTIGICFGHQIIALALGGKVAKSSKGWGVGVHTYTLRDSKEYFDNQISLSFLVSHQDQVIIPPTQAKILAWSDFCPNAMLSYGDSMISVQGHPELSKEYAQTILDIRREDIGEQAYHQALLDYQKPTDNILLINGMLSFLRLSPQLK